MKKLYSLAILLLVTIGCKNNKAPENKTIESTEDTEMSESVEKKESSFSITPISHASAVFNWDETVFYIDPVGGTSLFDGKSSPEIILITDIHGDHLNVETITGIIKDSTQIIAPQAVYDLLPDNVKQQTIVLNNEETKTINGFTIEAIPMYNLREEALKFHEKGRGNGYVIEKNGERVYFSGDTEDIPEMRALKNINKAFVCMNLPYTMTVESAADAVLAFKPDEVYPYHYRGTEGLSDVEAFKKLVNAGNPGINVIQLDWYPEL